MTTELKQTARAVEQRLRFLDWPCIDDGKEGADTIAALLAALEAAEADAAHMTEAIMHAYGHLWHINNEPMAPIPLRLEGEASYAARKILRDMLTHEQRGIGINLVHAAIAAGKEALK